MKGLIIDSFAGGGGASLGIAWATGRAPDVAINQDAAALAMHEANHPSTRHLKEDVWKAHPRTVTKGRKVALLWASPDCKHFSRAKGGKPVEKKIRSLAWVVVRWAIEAKPAVIILENVREFEDWGPLDANNRPCPLRKGLTFRKFCGRLRGLGYKVEHKTLNAADYGAPTHRRRLFLIARRDGKPIVWPEPSHGDPKKLGAMPLFERLKPWRTAAECIDWSIPCPSIFDRKRPLAEKTMRRIALGIKRYVLDSAEPFIVSVAHTGTTGRGTYEDSIGEPLKTVTKSNDKAIVTPVVVRYNSEKSEGDIRAEQIDEPCSTLDTQNRLGIATPIIVPLTHNGERRSNKADEPLPTVTGAQRGELALISPTLIECAYGDKGRWGSGTPGLDAPLGTIHSGGKNYALVSAFLARHFGGMVGCELPGPLPTVTAKDHHSLVAANLVHLNHGDKQWNSPGEPLRTQTTANHAALAYSFLVKYFGTAIGANLLEPLHTATGKHRFGLVTVTINGEPYVIVDIGMRMLSPRELARAQGFPDTYILTGTKTSQVARIGNSVVPHVAAAVVKANCGKAVACA